MAQSLCRQTDGFLLVSGCQSGKRGTTSAPCPLSLACFIVTPLLSVAVGWGVQGGKQSSGSFSDVLQAAELVNESFFRGFDDTGFSQRVDPSPSVQVITHKVKPS